MAAVKKVRVYELARELKQDAKKIIEDLRREGADVSVPSNSVTAELADKVRAKYIPKAEVAPKRSVKVIKAAKVVKKDDAGMEAVTPSAAEETEASAPAAETAPVADTTTGKTTVVRKILKKKTTDKAVETSEPVTEAAAETAEPAPQEEKVVEKPQEPAETSTNIRIHKPGTQVKKLTLTRDALDKGVKPGERVVADAPTRVGRLAGDIIAGREARPVRGEFRGTPGETSSPQTVYTPSPDNRRRPGRSGGRKSKTFETKSGRFAEKEIELPRQRTIEERIIEQIGPRGDGEFKPVRLVEGATVREFAEALGVPPRDIVQLLVTKGIFATLNQPIGEDIAVELGIEFGFDVTFRPFEESITDREIEVIIEGDGDDIEEPRPPVVTVMGHVDHGKTSLLDAIRRTNVAEGEAGGITQHIGAYSVNVPSPDDPSVQRRVVFLDTPGHEAFTMMRARGAKATDIVILVVAADDGVMPQTIEAVEHSKAAGVPIIVAINKIDKPDANPDKVKQGLAALGLQPVEWGGNTEMVPVSAKNRQGLDALLETVLLQADILELKASPKRLASGVVLEAKLDRGRGAVATVLVQQGTLRVGDPFIVGQYYGKVRAMFSDRGEPVTEAPPSTPVEVLGLQGVPQAGNMLQVVTDVEQAQSIANKRQMQARQAALLKTTKRGIESLGQAEVKELLVVLKADVQGSVEVLKATLEKLSTDKVKVRVIRAGVGAIAESDVLLASATQADNESTAVVIIGFNVRPEPRVADIAKQEGVEIRLHSVIYKVEEEIKAAMIGMLDAIEKESILGKALVQETFRVSKIGTIAGCRVTEGVIRRQAKARLIRDGVVAWTGDIASLKRFKDDTSEVRQGYECGISLVNFNDIKVGDEIEAFVIEKIAPTEL
ncbi:MAG: translation initiation factor IF-2 [Pyrinomonadaceae bacterium]